MIFSRFDCVRSEVCKTHMACSHMFFSHVLLSHHDLKKKWKFFNHQNQIKANCIKMREPLVNNCLSSAGESTQILNSSERINKIWTFFILTNQKKLEQVRVKSKRRSFGLSELFQESSRLKIIFKSAWVDLMTRFNSFTVWKENDDNTTTNALHVKIQQEHVQPLLIFLSRSLNAVVTVLWLRCDFYVSSSVTCCRVTWRKQSLFSTFST